MHYYAAYAMARLAGLRPKAARTIATASQYVDDAVEADIQHHENGNNLAPIVTAHRLVELIENRDVNDQPFVWVPFHFFPGNKGPENKDQVFTEQLICRKDSPLINELIDQYLDLKDRPFALELIGLIAHVYADTFSHAGFSGVSSRRNKVEAASITPFMTLHPGINKETTSQAWTNRKKPPQAMCIAFTRPQVSTGTLCSGSFCPDTN